jgi:hypothetical protein
VPLLFNTPHVRQACAPLENGVMTGLGTGPRIEVEQANSSTCSTSLIPPFGGASIFGNEVKFGLATDGEEIHRFRGSR